MPQIGWGHLPDWQAGSPLTSILTPASQGHLVHRVGGESGTGPLKKSKQLTVTIKTDMALSVITLTD